MSGALLAIQALRGKGVIEACCAACCVREAQGQGCRELRRQRIRRMQKKGKTAGDRPGANEGNSGRR